MAQGAGWQARIGRDLRQIGPVRLAATVLMLALGFWVALKSWELPLSGDAERALYDLRFRNSAVRISEPDQRITLVVYNDQTLATLGKRSPLDRDMLARALTAIDRMGARAIGIDILIDQQQPEDEQLIAAFRQMRTPTFLAFTTNEANPDQMEAWQEEYLRGMLSRIGPGAVRPASVKGNPDLADGVVRRWPLPDSRLPLPMAAAMSPVHPEFRDHSGAIDFQLPADRETRRFPKISIEELAALEDPAQPPDIRALLVAAFAEQIRGRYVLIGGDIRDVDDFESPVTRFGEGWMKGIEVIGQMLAQQLDGRMRPPLPAWSLWLAAALVVAAGGITAAFEPAGWRLALALVVQIGLIAWLPFQLQGLGLDTLDLPAAGWGVGWLLAFIGVGTAARAVGSEQRRFAQSTLGKYLPPDIAAAILRDPDRLSLQGEKKVIYTLFTDLADFTQLSHAIEPEQLSDLLNRYLDLMSDIVLKHGGTIDKFVGDAVVAFWGAPIARDDDGDRALSAAIAMYQAGNEFAASAGADLPEIGKTRVGLHRGHAVVGNFGGEGRIQYTALGDGMNTGARLESANKSLKTTVLVSGEAKDGATQDLFRPMGRIVVSGRATPVEVWEPVPDMDETLRKRLNMLWLRFDGGDSDALVQLQCIVDEHKEDAALGLFVHRCRTAGPGGHFVLDTK